MKFTGIVKRHLGRGKELGFPTANIDAPFEILDGLYLAWTVINPVTSLLTPPVSGEGSKLPSLAFIGSNKTFGETERVAEIYILDFDQDLYDKQIEVELVEKLRPVIKFNSQGTLIKQMHNDVKEARRRFKKLV